MSDSAVTQETEIIYRRLNEAFSIGGKQYNPHWWLAILIPVLVLAVLYVVYMYRKDSRSVHWRWATFLGCLRLGVYGLLAYMFLLPAKQTWEKAEKRSRVVLVLDVSESMSASDDAPDASSKPRSRMSKVLDFLSDGKIGFLKKVLDNNPVYVYRMGARLDEDSQAFERRDGGTIKAAAKKGGTEKDASKEAEAVTTEKSAERATRDAKGRPDAEYGVVTRTVTLDNGTAQREYAPLWTDTQWADFAKYDFKPWILKNLSPDGGTKLKASPAWGGDIAGTADWAKGWLEKSDSERIPTDLSDADAAFLKNIKPRLEARMDVARTISQSTNVPDSLLATLNREASNMVQGIIVISDGRSNTGSDSAIAELRARAKRAGDGVPIFTIGVGEDRSSVVVRITDVQAPDQTPPDEAFKIIVEVDGEGLIGQTVPITLEFYPPKSETPHVIESKVTFSAGEPPHGQVEVVIDPEKMPEILKSKESQFKDMLEGEWRIVASTPRAAGEKYDKPKHVSEPTAMKIEKKPLRILIFASGPNKDYQFLVNQMIRDNADVSVLLQNDAGGAGKIALLDDPTRVLTRFPTKLRVEDDPAEPADEKWYNLGRYDVIIAFDPDWNQLTPDQIAMVETWVNLQAGGLLLVAGPIHTKFLSRIDENSKFRPLLDIYPVQPGDIDLAAIKRDAKEPYALKFVGVNPETDFLKLDDEKDGPTAGWNEFFYGKADPNEGTRPIRGFFNYYPINMVKTSASIVAGYTDPNALKMADGREPPFLVTMRWGQGMTAFLGSSEIWRLRGYREAYFERFWTKLTRYLSSGTRRKQNRRGRLLMTKEFTSGSYIRVSAQLLDASLKPLGPNEEPKMTITPVELDSYADKDHDKEHKRFTKEFRLSAKKGPEEWTGMFQRQILASPEAFPPGQYRVDVAIPDSTDTLRSKFTIRKSNPETDNLRPDYAALAAMAGDVSEVEKRVTDKSLQEAIRSAATRAPDGLKLAFRFENKQSLDLIPEFLLPEQQTLRNRGAVEDLWDKGPELPRFITNLYSDKPGRVGWMLLACVFLLSVEWLTRKLLRLA